MALAAEETDADHYGEEAERDALAETFLDAVDGVGGGIEALVAALGGDAEA